MSSNPTPFSGSLEHQSAFVQGFHQHYFINANETLSIGTGDVLYAYVYLDPTAMPSEIMLQWNDGTGWEHRAYWGSDQLSNGVDGTPGRRYIGPLPAAGQWVQLKVPASQVNLQGVTVSGMAFTLYNGRATWDAAGRVTASGGNGTISVSLSTTNPVVSRVGGTPTIITFSRSGDTQSSLMVNYSLRGNAVAGQDFQLSPGNSGTTVSIPAGAASANLQILPLASTNFMRGLALHFAVAAASSYQLGNPVAVDLTISGNTVPASLKMSPQGTLLTWPSISNKQYRIGYKNNLTDQVWTPIGQVTATNSTSSWADNTVTPVRQRFYLVAQVN